MEQNKWYFRLLFLAFACLAASAACGLLAGIPIALVAFGALAGIELYCRKISTKKINKALLSLLFGTLIGLVVASSVRAILLALDTSLATSNLAMLYSFLAACYVGSMSLLGYEKLFSSTSALPISKKKQLVLDLTAIEDPRLIELARSGLLDQSLVIPHFILSEIQKSFDSPDENVRLRAKRCQEHVKRLESFSELQLEIKEFASSEDEEINSRLVRAAKSIDGYILSSYEPSQLKADEDIPTTISLDTIATALKPGAQRGEILQIKIQRLGKEPKQGVGYLDDGTMVVVNGGGEFLGQTIRTQVLSQKYSSSGKIIFCNAITQDEKGQIRLTESSPYHLQYQ